MVCFVFAKILKHRIHHGKCQSQYDLAVATFNSHTKTSILRIIWCIHKHILRLNSSSEEGVKRRDQIQIE